MVKSDEKTAYQKWLDSMDNNANLTKKGVRINLAMYVYPDGHGNLYFMKPDGGKLDDPGQTLNGMKRRRTPLAPYGSEEQTSQNDGR